MEFPRVEYRLKKQALGIWMETALVFKHQTDEKVKEKKQKKKKNYGCAVVAKMLDTIIFSQAIKITSLVSKYIFASFTST